MSDEKILKPSEELAEAAQLADDINGETGAVKNPVAHEEPQIEERPKTTRVSNWQILKNYRHYTPGERKHYSYIFWRRIGGLAWPIFRFLIIFGLSFVILYPILYMISTSLRPQSQMNDPSVMWIPKTIRWDNFKEVWRTIDYPNTLWNTIQLNVVASVLQVGSCALTGYGFARFSFKGKKFLFAMVLLQIIVPPQILIMPQYSLFKNFDLFGLVSAFSGDPISLLNTNFSMYIPAIFGNGIRGGLFIYLFRQFFRGLPKELEDAAYLDGCGPFKTFISVMVPNAASSFLTVFIFSIVWYWNDYYISSMFFTNSQTISLKVSNLANIMAIEFTGKTGVPRDYMVWVEAGCLMAILPIIIMYIFLQKYFTEGIERAGLAN
ncbi:MAG: carbohydrate ABC transporter permease [Oscillospiraceae bacterium]|nr:carbohydrate ABC transporter permease [Oscillospiraceae bacterium]